ncbi:MAG: BMP family ABC transporter substrate-binding protein, partial [Ilumatobacter sp.]|nr:BMP family ABC transporter substrate-binding protein [Ilumatobacter sp.]
IAADLIALQSVLDQFASHRLLTFDRDLTTGSPTVEVAHEALLLEWPRLRRWIDEGQKDVLRHRRLTTALTEWRASGEKVDYLLTGERLADYSEWAAVSTLQLTRAEERYLDASIVENEERALAEEQRHAREVKLDRQARRRLWGLGVGAALVAAATAGAFVAAGGGGQPAIALVHGVAGDAGINDMMISGVGIAEGTHGIEVDLEPPLIDPEEHLRQLAEAGTELLIVGSEFDLEVARLALDYPDVHWVAIDPVAVHTSGPNLTEMHFAVEDSAYVAGAAAALTSSTGRVGFVGGVQSFRTEASRNGFEQGAVAERSDVDVVSAFIGPVADPLAQAERSEELAFELATDMYASGVDVIFHDAGAAGAGVVRAAVARSDSGDHVWAIGSDADEFYTVPPSDRGVVLSSTIKRFDTAVEAAIEGFLGGSLEAGEFTLDFIDDGVDVSLSGGHIGPAIAARLRKLEGDVSFGHVSVSPYAARAPIWQLDADVVVALALDGEKCSVDRIDGAVPDGEHLTVERGSIIRFDVDNRSADLGGFSIRTIPVGMTLADARAEIAPGDPSSLGDILGITVAQLGAGTSTAVLVEGEPIVPNCILGDPAAPVRQDIPMIVRPT